MDASNYTMRTLDILDEDDERERQAGPDCRAEYDPRTHTLDHFECDPMRCVDRVFLYVGD